MENIQKRPKSVATKSALIFQKYKQAEQAEEEKRKAEAIERIIEAKVSMALRLLLANGKGPIRPPTSYELAN